MILQVVVKHRIGANNHVCALLLLIWQR